MGFATSLRSAARNLIETFGNTATIYSYSSATKTTNDEGDITVSSWGSGTSIKVADNQNIKDSLTQDIQGLENLGNDEKIVKDNVTVTVNDRLTVDGVNYKVTELSPTRTQDVLVVQTIKVIKVTDTTNW